MTIRRLRLSVVWIALLAPVAAECQSDAALWRFVYPNAKAVVSINWERIRQSPAFASIRDTWLDPSLAVKIPAGELLDETDRVVISSPGNPANGDRVDESAETPVVIVARGQFDPAHVRLLFQRIGAKAQAYNSFQVYRPQGKGTKNLAFVLFDHETLLFGDAPSLFAALDRSRFPARQPEPGSITARAAEMEAAYEFSLVMNEPDLLSSDRFGDIIPGADFASDAQGFEAGVSLRSGLAADITVHFASEASAKQVVTEITRLMSMVSKDKKAETQMQDIAKKLKFNSDGSAVKISLRLTPKELEKSAQAFAAGLKASSATPEPAALPPPVPAKPEVIRIEGLDEGAREIPYPPQQP